MTGTSTQLLIVTAGGLARETLNAVRAGQQYEPIGFVDDSPDLCGATVDGLKVLGGLDYLTRAEAAVRIVVCAGKGSVRENIVRRLAAQGVARDRFGTVIHPSVHVPENCRIGAGCVVLAGCVLTASVEIGNHVVAMPNVVLTHDDVIGDYATLCAGVVLGGSVEVGRGAYLGMACSVREGRRVGPDTVIGMGAAVLSDVPAGETWYGVPARPRAT